VNAPAFVAVRFVGLPTITSVAPAVCAGVTAASWVLLTKVTEVAATARVASANDTLAPLANPLPEIVTLVPPVVEPVGGLTEETVGAAAPSGKTQTPTLPSTYGPMESTLCGWKTAEAVHPGSRWQ
jgi:hypothetical protein